MSRRRRVRIDRLLIVILVSLLLVCGLGFGLYKLSGLFFKDEEPPVAVEPGNTDEPKTAISLSLDSYEVYLLEDLDFDFIIANVTLASAEEFSYSLANLVTEEKIALDNIYNYTKQLEAHSYNLAPFQLLDTITGKGELKASILIPFRVKDKLTVYNLMDGKALHFDLAKNLADVNSLKATSGSDIVLSNDLKVFVTDCYVSYDMYHDDEDVTYTDTISALTFKISITAAGEDAVIADAEYVVNNQTISALDAGWYSMKLDNALGKKLKTNTSYGIFFNVYNNDLFTGTLRLRLKGSGEWLEIAGRSGE